MKYDWNINELKRRKRLLLKLVDRKDIDKYELNEELNNLEEMINFIKNPYYEIKVYYEPNFNGYYDKNKLITKSNYSIYKQILPYIENKMAKARIGFGDFKDSHKEITLPKLKNIKELISMAYEVYRKLPTDDTKYLDLFLKYTNPYASTIKIVDTKINSNDSVYGYTYFNNIPSYEPYILIAKENNIGDLSVLCHEIGHAIFYNPSITTKNRSYYLGEVEGFYFDYLTRKYLSNIIDKKAVNQLDYNEFNTIYDGYISYYIMHLITDSYKKKKSVYDYIINNTIEKLEDNFNINFINESYIKHSLNLNNFIYSKYLISYLTALDIEQIEKYDPELAFYILNEVCSIKTNYIYPKLRKLGITFMDDNFYNLKNKVKHINRI